MSMSNNPRPILFLAFANDRDDEARYLRNLAEEARQVQRALATAETRGHCELVLRQNATAGDILDVFQDARYRDRIALFHFGGHADGYRLLLETAAGAAAAADAGGLARFLGQQRGPGSWSSSTAAPPRARCSGLLDAGVPAVIATAQAIDDAMATDFADRFYQGLAGGAAIGRRSSEARAAMQTAGRPRHPPPVDAGPGHAVDDRWPWRLHTGRAPSPWPDWNLPDAADDPLFGLPPLPPLDLPDKPYRHLDWYRREDAEHLLRPRPGDPGAVRPGDGSRMARPSCSSTASRAWASRRCWRPGCCRGWRPATRCATRAATRPWAWRARWPRRWGRPRR